MMILATLVRSMMAAARKSKVKSLKEYILKEYNIKKLPGELSVNKKIFTNELKKIKGPKKPGEALKKRVKNSEMNIKHILTGKGLMETFKAENKEVNAE